MKNLALTDSNDISIGADGQLSIATGKQSYLDIIACTIRTLKGECPLNVNKGIDYFGTVWTSVTRLNIWKHFVEEAVTALPFVRGIELFTASYSPSTKLMTYKLVVSTNDNETVSVTS